jgi:isopenicillin N synthase-like dioxygenase
MTPSTPISNGSENEDVVAELTVVSYEKLLRKDAAEADLLLSACAECGFFYLDLRGDETKRYLGLKNTLFGLSREYFARPLEEKLKDTRDEISVFNICGYKPLGLDSGNVEHKKDGCEGMRDRFPTTPGARLIHY